MADAIDGLARPCRPTTAATAPARACILGVAAVHPAIAPGEVTMSAQPAEIPAGVSIEEVWLVECTYTPEAAERRPAVRATHLARVSRLKQEGTLIEGGAYTDGLTTSIMLIRAATAEAARAIAQADVYITAGVWGAISVRPFGRVRI
jgi:hypothetical protein